MLKYLAKISMDIFPSVLATIIGAYIVNHYINARPAADTPRPRLAPADAGKRRQAGDPPMWPTSRARRQGQGRLREEHDREGGGREARGESSRLRSQGCGRQAVRRARRDREPSRAEKAAAKSASGCRDLAVAKRPAPAGAAAVAATPVANVCRAAGRGRAAPRIIARPTIWRAQRSSASAQTAKLAEAQEAARTPERRALQEAPPLSPLRAPSTVRPLPPPITVSTPAEPMAMAARRRQIRPTRPRSATTTRIG